MSEQKKQNLEEIQEEPKEEVKKEERETITVDKEKFSKLMSRVERLESSADKGRLNRYDSLQEGEREKIVKLRTIDGKVITKVTTIENRVEKNPNTGVFTENQLVEVKYENGRKEKMPYVEYSRRYEYLPGVVKKETFDKEQKITIFTVETDDEKTYEISEKYIN